MFLARQVKIFGMGYQVVDGLKSKQTITTADEFTKRPRRNFTADSHYGEPVQARAMDAWSFQGCRR